MKLTNPWVNYIQRNYSIIKLSIINRVKNLVPEITDYNESNIFVIIISSFAGLIEQLNYYIDNMARELYISTARRYSSMYKITRLINYRIKSRSASQVDLKFTAVDVDDEPFSVLSDIVINSGTRVKTSSNIIFTTTSTRHITTGGSSVVIPAKQVDYTGPFTLGQTSGVSKQTLDLPDDFTDNLISLVINLETYNLVDTFSFSKASDKHFILRVNENKKTQVIFGDNINGVIPPSVHDVIIHYYKTKGIEGNVSAETIDTWVDVKPDLVASGAEDLLVNNLQVSMGGQDVEGVEQIRAKAPLSLLTLQRAVTLGDFSSMAKMVPGVRGAYAEFNNVSKDISVFIASETRGVPSAGLLQDVIDYLEVRKLIGTQVVVKSSGETIIDLSISVKLRNNMVQADALNKITSALLDEFGYNNSDVNKPVRLSDVIALVDNLPAVDYLNIFKFTTIPYPHIVSGTNELYNNCRIEVYSGNTIHYTWTVYLINSTTARIFRGDTLVTTISSIPLTDPGGKQYSGPQIAFTMWGTYTSGDSFVFKTYPFNNDIVLDDNTIPVVDINHLNVIFENVM